MTMSDDKNPWVNPEEQTMLNTVTARIQVAMEKSGAYLAIVTPAYFDDPVVFLQIGVAVTRGMPMIGIIQEGTAVPENLKRLFRGTGTFVRGNSESIGKAATKAMAEAGLHFGGFR